MSTQIFDLETCPLPIAELMAAIPDFDPLDVKYGNAKDPEKRAAILANAEAKHRTDFIENAALDPRTGRIKIAGFRDTQDGTNQILVHMPEGEITNPFKDTGITMYDEYRSFLVAIQMRIVAAIYGGGQDAVRGDGKLMGYYIHDFDLPFLFQSCWMNGIPANVRHYRYRNRYWNENIVDLRETWCFGDRYAATGGLDGLGKLVGAKTRKTGDGKNFHIMWEQDPKAALEYVIGDLMQTEEIGRAIGEI